MSKVIKSLGIELSVSGMAKRKLVTSQFVCLSIQIYHKYPAKSNY